MRKTRTALFEIFAPTHNLSLTFSRGFSAATTMLSKKEQKYSFSHLADDATILIFMNDTLSHYDDLIIDGVVGIKTKHSCIKKLIKMMNKNKSQKRPKFDVRPIEESIVNSIKSGFNTDWSNRSHDFDDNCVNLAVLRNVFYGDQIRLVSPPKENKCGYCLVTASEVVGGKLRTCANCKNIKSGTKVELIPNIVV